MTLLTFLKCGDGDFNAVALSDPGHFDYSTTMRSFN